jgi:PAS domain S-box-containing protein
LATKEATVSDTERRGAGLPPRTENLTDDALVAMADAPAGAVVHRNGDILAANAAFAEMFGLADPATAAGMCVLDFVAPEARARVAAHITTPTDEPVFHDCLRLDGIPLMVRGEGRSVMFQGEPARLTLLTRVDDELRTADRLHESSEFFRLAFDHAPIGKALVSPDGRILYLNPALCELLGFEAAQMLGQSYNALSHADDVDVGTPHAVGLLQGNGDSYQIEKRYRHANGHEIWVAISVSLVRMLDGSPRYFIAQVEDITARREAEAALRLETERLRLMQTVAEAANTAEDPDAAYTTALAAVCAHTGWPLAHVYRSVPGGDLLEPSGLWHFTDGDATPFHDFVVATADNPLTSGVGLPGLAFAARRPAVVVAGDMVTVRAEAAARAGLRSATALPVFAHGDVVAVLEFFSHDADHPDDALLELLGHVGTQIGRVAERAQAREQAAALDEARSRFVAHAAHELRTPLSTLRTVAGLLGSRRAQMTEAELAECCELLERQGANLDALVDDLLDLSRLQHASGAEALRAVAVDEWVSRALAVALPPEGVTVHRSLGAGLCVLGDPDRLNRALVNLLANAYRHGGPSVTVRAERDGADVVTVVVEDDGDGVPEDLLPDLFEPFTRSDRSRGSGLGLAITRALVEQAGGTVAYRGSSDQGARFVLRLEEWR